MRSFAFCLFIVALLGCSYPQRVGYQPVQPVASQTPAPQPQPQLTLEQAEKMVERECGAIAACFNSTQADCVEAALATISSAQLYRCAHGFSVAASYAGDPLTRKLYQCTEAGLIYLLIRREPDWNESPAFYDRAFKLCPEIIQQLKRKGE